MIDPETASNATNEPAFALATPTPASPPSARPAGFWRRIFAFAIDIAILAAVGRLLGLFWFDSLAALGQHGLALGAATVLAYFGLLGSRLGGGATLGKRAMSLRLVGEDGGTLDPGVAILRTAVVVVPWVIVQLSVPPGPLATLHTGAAWCGVGLFGCCLYLYLFNTPSRRSLPDLLLGTVVVRASSQRVDELVRTPLWTGHYVTVVFGCVLAIAAWSRLPDPALDGDDGARIDRVRAVLQEKLGTVRVGTHMGYALTWRVADTPGVPEAETVGSRFVTITVGLVGKPESFDSVIDTVATTLLLEFPSAFDRGRIEITVLYGYDIGIAEGWIGHSIGLDPQEWRERIGARSIPA